MNTSQLLLAAVGALLLVLCSLTEGASIAESAVNDVEAKKELLFLAKILGPLREIAREADELAGIVEHVATDRDFSTLDLVKRQGAWDMDYGWGGGRFGKRGSTSTNSQQGKRYDSFGIAGRFGRSVDNIEQH